MASHPIAAEADGSPPPRFVEECRACGQLRQWFAAGEPLVCVECAAKRPQPIDDTRCSICGARLVAAGRDDEAVHRCHLSDIALCGACVVVCSTCDDDASPLLSTSCQACRTATCAACSSDFTRCPACEAPQRFAVADATDEQIVSVAAAIGKTRRP